MGLPQSRDFQRNSIYSRVATDLLRACAFIIIQRVETIIMIDSLSPFSLLSIVPHVCKVSNWQFHLILQLTLIQAHRSPHLRQSSSTRILTPLRPFVASSGSFIHVPLLFPIFLPAGQSIRKFSPASYPHKRQESSVLTQRG